MTRNRIRWRSRYRFWRQTGRRLSMYEKRAGTSAFELDDGRVVLTETGYAHSDYDEAWEPPTGGFR